MSEAVEQIAIHKLPLDEIHRQGGALMVEREGWSVPASYGDTSAEYSTVRDGGAGLIDLSAHARIEVSGTEAVQFLNGLVTNDVKTLSDGAWMPAAFPTPQGRLIASTRVIRRQDAFLFETEATSHTALLKTLERFTLAGDFRVKDLTDSIAQLSIQGARSAEIINQVLGEEAGKIERLRAAEILWKDTSVSAIRATHTGEDGFDLFIDAAQALLLWQELRAAGARPFGFDALEILRIEAGLPRYGLDMDETNIVTEAGLDDAVSYTKGCYTGQEIIARIHWRGHVAKKLTGLVFDAEGNIERDAKIRTEADGKEIGRITSTTFSPRLDKRLALGYVKYDYLKPGTRVKVASGTEEREATVTELPFVRGSWSDAAAAADAEGETGA
ncbi:MAG TPA: aminomethyltransferase family protein [Pyrinomonadaceae bacterium]|nr:aminomethyltransferase family protein [Pyrinomonadaceae bacterium]